jgi:DNA gyrase subunit B
VEVRRDGKIYFQRYERGRPVEAVKEIGTVPEGVTGNRTTFRFDKEIFKEDIVLPLRYARAALP